MKVMLLIGYNGLLVVSGWCCHGLRCCSNVETVSVSADFKWIVIVGIQLTLEVQKDCGPTIREFKAKVSADAEVKAKLQVLKNDVEEFAVKFPLPGHDDL